MKIVKPSELAKEIGIEPGDTVEIRTPAFNRPPNWKGANPAPDPFDRVRAMSRIDLHNAGCRPWDVADAQARVLMLFPAEWYDSIPDGFEIVDINMRAESFKRGTMDDDRRFGMLAYGVLVHGFGMLAYGVLVHDERGGN